MTEPFLTKLKLTFAILLWNAILAGGFQVVLRNFSKQFLHRVTRSGYVLVTKCEAGTLVPTSRLSSVQLGPLRTSLKQLVQQF